MKGWENETSIKLKSDTFSSDYLFDAGKNLKTSITCSLLGGLAFAIAPNLRIQSRDQITKEVTYDYTPVYVVGAIGLAFEIAAIVNMYKCGNNLQKASRAKQKLTYRLSPFSGEVCFRF
jgi:hypothetical protein